MLIVTASFSSDSIKLGKRKTLLSRVSQKLWAATGEEEEAENAPVVTREEVIGNLLPGSVINLLFSNTPGNSFFSDFNDI